MNDKKKILLLSNFENTKLYHKLFYIFKNDFDIFWFVVNKSNYQFLKKFYDEQKIIYINKKNFEYHKSSEFKHEIKLNELIFSDRALKLNDKNINYLNKISSIIYDFFKKNKISFVFGEFTWSYELVISRIAKNLNILYLNLQSTRYPSNRFLFFLNERQDKFYLRNKEDLDVNFQEASNNYEIYIKNKKLKNRNILYIFKKSINLILETYFDKDDPTYSSRFVRINLFLKKKIFSFLYRFVKKIDQSELKRNYLIYFLQKQPEATTDIKGMYYSDQLENIKMIWKILPQNFDLIVKEHPNCKGDRSIGFYKDIIKLKNVYLSNDKNFDEIIKGSKATFSIASTASLKSALMGIPSFTFTETFFNCLNFSFRVSIEDLRNCQNFFTLLHQNLNKLKENNNFYLRNSFPGVIDPDKIDHNIDNLNNIQKAIREVIS